MKNCFQLKWALPVALLLLSACGDGHSGDEEEGHYSTYDLANSDTATTSGNTQQDDSTLRNNGGERGSQHNLSDSSLRTTKDSPK